MDLRDLSEGAKKGTLLRGANAYLLIVCRKLQLPSYQFIGLIDSVIGTPNRRRRPRTWEELTRSASACDAPRQLTSDSSTDLCPESHDISYNHPPLIIHPRGRRSTRSGAVTIWACPKSLDY